jgi:MoxR-like ATPase
MMWYRPDRPQHIQLPPADFVGRFSDPAGYVPSAGLEAAINVSLALRKPLLVAGEPGVGKSSLAFHLAWALSLRGPLTFYTKSTSSLQDLFYAFDVVGRLRDAQMSQFVPLTKYISLGPLGQAIYDAQVDVNLRDDVSLRDSREPRSMSVVLIDEIDKAPRDFPNDFLHELEYLSFRIKELDNVEIRSEPQFAPVIVVTTNSERTLPDAFLRRCVFYTIPFPHRAHLSEILYRRLIWRESTHQEDIDSAIEFFTKVRESQRIQKRPGIGELLDWLRVLDIIKMEGTDRPHRSLAALLHSLPALVKTAEDQIYAEFLVKEWVAQFSTS